MCSLSSASMGCIIYLNGNLFKIHRNLQVAERYAA